MTTILILSHSGALISINHSKIQFQFLYVYWRRFFHSHPTILKDKTTLELRKVQKIPIPARTLKDVKYTSLYEHVTDAFAIKKWDVPYHTSRGERERLFGSREREGKLKITFPFYGKGTGIRKLLREGKGNLRLVIPGIPGNPGNHIKSKIKFKIIFMPWQAIRSQSFFNQCKDDICNRFTQL